MVFISNWTTQSVHLIQELLNYSKWIYSIYLILINQELDIFHLIKQYVYSISHISSVYYWTFEFSADLFHFQLLLTFCISLKYSFNRRKWNIFLLLKVNLMVRFLRKFSDINAAFKYFRDNIYHVSDKHVPQMKSVNRRYHTYYNIVYL